MKRLLLITYAFPPAPSPGALRPGYLARYLPEFGWEADVVTRDHTREEFFARVGSRFGADPHAPLRSLLRNVKETLIFPDATAPWMPDARRRARALLEERRYDAILSTALPTSVHVVAAELTKRYGIPWIADYRDPWSGNQYMPWGPAKRALMRAVERRLLRRARAITTISPAIAEILRVVHPDRTIDVIPNAYDPADWDGISAPEPEHFDLCFTGSLYDGKRSPDLLFEAIALLRAQGDPAGADARVHFYGPNSERVAASAARFGLSLLVRQHGVVPRRDALLAQRSAAALLVLLNMDPATAHETGSKYLEYLGARRPMIVCGPSGSALAEIVQQHHLGWFAGDAQSAAGALRAAHRRWRDGAAVIEPGETGLPSARDLAGAFAEVLDRAAGRAVAGMIPYHAHTRTTMAGQR